MHSLAFDQIQGASAVGPAKPCPQQGKGTSLPAAALKTPSAAALLVQVLMCDNLLALVRGDMR